MTDPTDLDAPARAAAVRGSLLFHLRLAEALAGDALAAATPDGVEGWALDVGADGYEVCALGGAGDVLRRVTFTAEGTAQVEAPLAAAAPRLRRLAAAREACVAAATAYPHRYAALVVPPPRDGREASELEGYLMRLPDRVDDVALGPHWRLRLSGDGVQVRDVAPACGADAVAAGAGARGRGPLSVTHEGAAAPSELHVLLSLQHGLVLDVSTPATATRWRVDGERVTRR